MKFLTLSLSILLLLFSLPARGQVGPAFPNSITAPGQGVPGEPSLFSAHPDAPSAMLSLSGWRFGLTGVGSLGELSNAADSTWPVSGGGLFLVYPIPFLGVAVGGAAHLLSGSGWTAGRLTTAFGMEITPTLSWGVNYSYISSPTYAGTNGTGGISLQLCWQPSPFFGLAFRTDSLLMEPADGLPMQRIHHLGVQLGRHHQLWATGHFGERRRQWGGEIGGRFMPFRGIYLWASGGGATHPSAFYLPSHGDASIKTPRGWYMTGGVTLSLEHLFLSMEVLAPHLGLSYSAVLEQRRRLTSLLPDPEHTILLDLSKEFTEQRHFSLLVAYEACLRNSQCKGMVVKASDSHVGWAFAEEWSRRISHMRRRGKKVMVYGYTLGNAMYALAAAADKIILFPGGSLTLKGLQATRLSIGEGLSKLGVKAQFVRYSSYKSAPELFTRRSPSQQTLATMSRILKMSERRFRALVLQRKGFTVKRLLNCYQRSHISAPEALKLGLVDGLRYMDQMDRAAALTFGQPLPLMDPSSLKPRTLQRGGRGVGLLLLEGEIVTKATTRALLSRSKEVVLSTTVKALGRAAGDPRIAAIVIRINSPGGSALASDVLWRTIQRINRRKPIIFSFGEFATSGGYYIAAGAKLIFAEGSTITGSIGIFGGKFSLQELLRKLGVGVTTLKRAPFADMNSHYRPYTPAEINQLKRSLLFSYRRFLMAVARGRSLSQAELKKIAGGRIWTGEEAKKRHLVDRLGGLYEALSYAKRLTGLSQEARVYKVYPPPPSLIKRLLRQKLGIPIGREPGSLKLLPSLPSSLLHRGPWTRAPFNLEIR